MDVNKPQPAEPEPVAAESPEPSKFQRESGETIAQFAERFAQAFVESLNAAALRDEPKP